MKLMSKSTGKPIKQHLKEIDNNLKRIANNMVIINRNSQTDVIERIGDFLVKFHKQGESGIRLYGIWA